MQLLCVFLIFVMVFVAIFRPQKRALPEEKSERSRISKQAPGQQEARIEKRILSQPEVLKLLIPFSGSTISEVFYGLVNYQGESAYDFGDFHLVDKAILIKFSNGEWLNWVWEEQGLAGPEIQIKKGDERQALQDGFTQLLRVDQHPFWAKLKQHPVLKIQPIFPFAQIKDSAVSDLIFVFPDQDMTFSAIAEPEPELLPDLSELTFEPDWTFITLEDVYMKTHHRGRYTIPTTLE